MKRASSGFVETLGYHAGLSLLCLAMIYPILWLVATSFKPAGEIWTRVSSLVSGVSFAVYYRNTIFHATVGTAAAIVSSTVVAFGFARIDFPGKKSGSPA